MVYLKDDDPTEEPMTEYWSVLAYGLMVCLIASCATVPPDRSRLTGRLKVRVTERPAESGPR